MRINGKVLSVLGRDYLLSRDKLLSSDGFCCPVEETITINPTCANMPRTVLHEAVHAVVFSGGLFEAIDNEKLIEILCEQVARVVDENFEIKWRKK